VKHGGQKRYRSLEEAAYVKHSRQKDRFKEVWRATAYNNSMGGRRRTSKGSGEQQYML
jgi:hypothetical protein